MNIARTAHAAGDDKIRIALIGCGGRGNGAANDNLSSCEGTRLVAVAHISNALGTVLPVKKMIDRAHASEAKQIVDFAADRGLPADHGRVFLA